MLVLSRGRLEDEASFVLKTVKSCKSELTQFSLRFIQKLLNILKYRTFN